MKKTREIRYDCTVDTRNQLVLPPVHDLLHILRRSQPPTLTRPEDIKKKWRVRYVWEDGSSGHGGRRRYETPRDTANFFTSSNG